MGRDSYRGSGRGHRGGRGNHGGGRHRGRNSNRRGYNSTKEGTRELKFAPQVQGKQQQATYATVKDALIQYIQMNMKDSEDVVASLKKMEKIDLSDQKPKLQISKKSDEKVQAQEQKGFDIEFQELLSRYLDRETALRHGYKTAYS
jgi:hypothetical protein